MLFICILPMSKLRLRQVKGLVEFPTYQSGKGNLQGIQIWNTQQKLFPHCVTDFSHEVLWESLLPSYPDPPEQQKTPKHEIL